MENTLLSDLATMIYGVQTIIPSLSVEQALDILMSNKHMSDKFGQFVSEITPDQLQAAVNLKKVN